MIDALQVKGHITPLVTQTLVVIRSTSDHVHRITDLSNIVDSRKLGWKKRFTLDRIRVNRAAGRGGMGVRRVDATFDSSTAACSRVSLKQRRPGAQHHGIALEKAGTVGHDFVLKK